MGSEHTPMAPVVDGKWISDDPKQMLRDRKFKKCPILTGVSKNEGSVFMLYSNPEVFTITGYTMNQDQLKATITSLFNHHLEYPKGPKVNFNSVLLIVYFYLLDLSKLQNIITF